MSDHVKKNVMSYVLLEKWGWILTWVRGEYTNQQISSQPEKTLILQKP